MLKIALENLRFFCNHGLQFEEELISSPFEVNLEVYYKPTVVPIVNIEHTIDYTTLYAIVKQVMQVRTELLETLATAIGSQVVDAFPEVEEVKVCVKKLNPPIPSIDGSVGVTYFYKKEKA